MAHREGRYALPIPGDWNGEDWDCCILYYPDSNSWRAIMAGLVEALSRGRTWDEHTGNLLDVLETAKLIALAFNASDEVKSLPQLEGIMGCFDELIERTNVIISHVDEVEELLNLIRLASSSAAIPCCDGMNATEDSVERPPEMDMEDPPTHWGDEPVSDWDEFMAYVCAASHRWVDLMIGKAQDMQAAISSALLLIVVIASVLGILSGAGLLLAVSYSAAAAAFSGLVNMVGTAAMSQAASDLEEARDDIVCAIMTRQSPASAVATAVGEPAWSGFFRWVSYLSVLHTIWAGGNQSGALPATLDERECDCDEPPQDFYTKVIYGAGMGGTTYADGAQPGDSASYVGLAFFSDSDFVTPVNILVSASNDTQYGLRFPPQKVYRCILVDETFSLQSNTTYPDKTLCHLILIKHTGQAPSWTIDIFPEMPAP